MAKIFFSNKSDIANKVLANVKKQEFEVSYQFSNDYTNVISFYKKTNKHDNFYIGGDDFIIGAGSIIYNNSTKTDALRSILSDFHSKNDISKLKRDILGNYALLIKKNNNIYIFNDECHSIPIFYFNKGNEIVVGSDLYDISKNINKKISINEDNFLEGVFQNAILGKRTMFNEINKLLGHEFIEIELDKISFKVHEIENKIPFKLNTSSREIQIKEYARLIVHNAKEVKNHFKNIGIFMTGGLDSRVILATFLNVGIKPTLFYGVGNSTITNTNNEDYEIVKQIAKRYNLKMVTMNWESHLPIDKYWDKLPGKYGFSADMYSGTKNVIDEIEKIKGIDFFEFGYMGESIKNNKWVDNINVKTLNIPQLTDLYIHKYNLGIIRNSKKLKTNIESEFKNISLRFGINNNKISKDEYQVFDNEYRLIADTVLLSFMNNYRYSISIVGQRKVVDFMANIPYEYKINNSIPIDVIKLLYSDLLNIPILSHQKPMIIDGLKKKENNKKRKISFKKIIKKLIRYNSLLHKTALRVELLLFRIFYTEDYPKSLSSNYIKIYLSKEYKQYNNKGIKSISYAPVPYIARYYLMRIITDDIIHLKN